MDGQGDGWLPVVHGWDDSNGEWGHEMVAETLYDHWSSGYCFSGNQSAIAYLVGF